MPFRSRWRLLALAMCFAGLPACMAARGVRPVGEGKLAVCSSIGGPMFTNLGGAIPAPVVNAGVRYGLTGRTDLDVGLSVPIACALGLDAGASHLLFEEEGFRPALVAGGRLNFWASPCRLSGSLDPNGREKTVGPRLFEEAYAYGSWKLGTRSLAYVGLDLFAQLEEATVRPSLLAGVEWRPGRLLGFQLELKQMAFLTNQKFAAVSFIGPGDYGAFAVDLGVNVYPGSEP